MDREERRILENARQHLRTALAAPADETDKEIRESLQLIQRLREADD